MLNRIQEVQRTGLGRLRAMITRHSAADSIATKIRALKGSITTKCAGNVASAERVVPLAPVSPNAPSAKTPMPRQTVGECVFAKTAESGTDPAGWLASQMSFSASGAKSATAARGTAKNAPKWASAPSAEMEPSSVMGTAFAALDSETTMATVSKKSLQCAVKKNFWILTVNAHPAMLTVMVGARTPLATAIGAKMGAF